MCTSKTCRLGAWMGVSSIAVVALLFFLTAQSYRRQRNNMRVIYEPTATGDLELSAMETVGGYADDDDDDDDDDALVSGRQLD